MDHQHKQSPDALRQVPRWVHAYAANRTLPVIVWLSAFALLFGLLGGLSLLTGWAWQTTNIPLFVISAVLLCTVLIVVIWLSIPAWGGRWQEELAQALLHDEGTTRLPLSAPRRWMKVVSVVFLICVFTEVGLGLYGVIPMRWMQPISAAYVVPFLLLLTRLHGGTGFVWGYIWAVLYGLHAVLLALGAPIYFIGRWEGLNMLLPVVGYGLIAALAGLLYSKVMLARVKGVALATQHPEEGA